MAFGDNEEDERITLIKKMLDECTREVNSMMDRRNAQIFDQMTGQRNMLDDYVKIIHNLELAMNDVASIINNHALAIKVQDQNIKVLQTILFKKFPELNSVQNGILGIEELKPVIDDIKPVIKKEIKCQQTNKK